MDLDRNTMICLALVAVGGVAVGALVLDALPEDVTIEYSIMCGTQGDEYVAWYFFDMSDAPDGTTIYYKGASDPNWSSQTYHEYNEPLLRIKNIEPSKADALSMDFYGKADGYSFKFVCTSSP